ncbi:hypothetical protein GCM10010174_73270 [Kutzneria viridogrisea]|uniref:SH3b domain-containing protein n=2 Tax=Kutzneria TaxID=43356 RepID=W5W9E5_9PSEU|nr:SH3 domain-containing protein [Kutzneria albida]AHH97380.1 hypothetical protein KALB_4016 [Kutzneria albida DSM 43870]MBA8930702.1 uncharacterized protein YraI [Kutzneria viridogrisea]
MRATIATAVVLAATALTVAGGQALAAAKPTAVASPANCGWQPANNDNNTSGRFADDGVNIRSGDSTSCAVLGLGYKSHTITLRCFWNGFVYLTDNTTGVTGWSAVDYVNWPGGLNDC